MVNNYRAPNKNYQSGGHTFDRTRCITCGKQHSCECLSGMDGFFSYGIYGHKIRECPRIKSKGKEANQAYLDPNAPKKNPRYGMGARK